MKEKFMINFKNKNKNKIKIFNKILNYMKKKKKNLQDNY